MVLPSHGGSAPCPICRTPITKRDLFEVSTEKSSEKSQKATSQNHSGKQSVPNVDENAKEDTEATSLVLEQSARPRDAKDITELVRTKLFELFVYRLRPCVYGLYGLCRNERSQLKHSYKLRCAA